jgi:translation elongation factor EF-1alpha
MALAVNKMDLLDFRYEAFEAICRAFADFAAPLGFASVTAVPLSALHGDNVTSRSTSTPWYTEPTLMGWLEAVEVVPRAIERLVFPVQWVNRPNAEFRGFCGTVADGSVRPGDEIRVTASGQTAGVSGIVTMDGLLSVAPVGRAVTLTLDREINVSRGDVISLAAQPHIRRCRNVQQSPAHRRTHESAVATKQGRASLCAQSSPTLRTRLDCRPGIAARLGHSPSVLTPCRPCVYPYEQSPFLNRRTQHGSSQPLPERPPRVG